ncbi:MAG: hypothetical protein ACRDRJ_52995 [Streptosporangiaceae bacterium]
MIKLRRRWRIWLAAPAAVIVTALGSTIPAQARPSPSARPAASPVTTTRSLRSLDRERPPAGSSHSRWVVSDPVAYRQAVKTGNWEHTPDGLSFRSCVYHVPDRGLVRKNEIVAPSGAIHKITPCTHPTIVTPGSAGPGAIRPGAIRPSAIRPSASEPAPGTNAPLSGPCGFGPGGHWWAASCYGSAPAWVTSFDQEYAVPSNPAKTGALIFLWGGIENATGNTLLQDVLTWGANGNIVTQPNVWYVNNWYLWPGNNSVISPAMHVNPTDTIVADLTASNCSSAGSCTWVLKSTDTVSGRSTSYTVGSGVAFDLLIGSDMEVPSGEGCVETPTNGHAAFRDLTVKGNTGTITPDFGISYPDPQCSISMTQTSSAADILWKTS